MIKMNYYCIDNIYSDTYMLDICYPPIKEE